MDTLIIIPEHLFDGITTTSSYATNSFGYTFHNCTNLESESAKINGEYLYNIWPNASNQQTYTNDTTLKDYDAIPAGKWK